MYRAVCSDTALGKLADAGIVESVGEGVLSGKYSPRSYAAAGVRAVGRQVYRDLGLSGRCGFDAAGDLHLALGALVLEGRPLEGSSWRVPGTKTYVTDFKGEHVFIEQVDTTGSEIMVPPGRGRSLLADWMWWPDMMALALLYYRCVGGGADVRRFAEEHFQAWEYPVERLLYGECLTAEDFGQPRGQYDGEPRLDGPIVDRLAELFSKPFPEAGGEPFEPVRMPGDDRMYFSYLRGEDLIFGIPSGSEHLSEEERPPSCLMTVEMFRGPVEVRDWLTFSPVEAGELLRACLKSYARDRDQVPEIIHLLDWGMDMESLTGT